MNEDHGQLVLALGTSGRKPWHYLLMPIPAVLLWGGLGLFLPVPYYVVVVVGVGFGLLAGVSMALLISAETNDLCANGIRSTTRFVRWNDVIGYRFWEPNGLSLTVVGETLRMPEDTLEMFCRDDLKQVALTAFEHYAPQARQYGE